MRKISITWETSTETLILYRSQVTPLQQWAFFHIPNLSTRSLLKHKLSLTSILSRLLEGGAQPCSSSIAAMSITAVSTHAYLSPLLSVQTSSRLVSKCRMPLTSPYLCKAHTCIWGQILFQTLKQQLLSHPNRSLKRKRSGSSPICRIYKAVWNRSGINYLVLYSGISACLIPRRFTLETDQPAPGWIHNQSWLQRLFHIMCCANVHWHRNGLRSTADGILLPWADSKIIYDPSTTLSRASYFSRNASLS